MKDMEDVRLESLFRSEEIADDGFSDRVVARVRHRIWIRRWTMPAAILIGASIAAKPATELLALLPTLMAFLPEEFRIMPENFVPQMSTLVVGAALAGVMTLVIRTLEE
jgi:hypothetical protein